MDHPRDLSIEDQLFQRSTSVPPGKENPGSIQSGRNEPAGSPEDCFSLLLNLCHGLYRGQSLKRVADGLRQNVLLYNWLQGNGIRCAKTKERKFRTGRQEPGQKARTQVPALCDEQKSQLSEITKAICGETYSYPTDNDSSKGS